MKTKVSEELASTASPIDVTGSEKRPADGLRADAGGAKARGIAIVTALAGMLFGASSLAYPFGPDQGLLYYDAREFLRSGAVLYRDVLDHKTPGIYGIHIALIALFGEHAWPIRLAEWLAMIPFGFLAARLATRAGERTPKPYSLLGVFTANILYFGFFNYWNSAQCEIWCALFTLVALWAVLRSSLSALRGAALAGVFAALVLAMKPPASPMVLVILGAVILAGRARGRETGHGLRLAAASAGAFAAGGALAGGAILAWFAAKGALPAMVDVLVHANAYYVVHMRSASGTLDTIERIFLAHHAVDPLSTMLHTGLLIGILRGGLGVQADARSRDRYLLALALIVAGTLGVVSQMKFYFYHWGLLVAGEVLLVLVLASDVGPWLANFEPALPRWRTMPPAWRSRIAFSIMPVALASTYALPMTFSYEWGEATLDTVRHVAGAMDRDTFTRRFRLEGLHFYYHDSEDVGLWLREHAKQGDRVLVRGFHPEIYQISGLSYGGRFYWDPFLVEPGRAYRRTEWLAQDREEFERVKPRWVVALRGRPGWPGWPEPTEIQSQAWFEGLGYRPVESLYQYVIMERVTF